MHIIHHVGPAGPKTELGFRTKSSFSDGSRHRIRFLVLWRMVVGLTPIYPRLVAVESMTSSNIGSVLYNGLESIVKMYLFASTTVFISTCC